MQHGGNECDGIGVIYIPYLKVCDFVNGREKAHGISVWRYDGDYSGEEQVGSGIGYGSGVEK